MVYDNPTLFFMVVVLVIMGGGGDESPNKGMYVYKIL